MRVLNLKRGEWSPPAPSPAATFSSARRGPRPRSTVADGGGTQCVRRPSATHSMATLCPALLPANILGISSGDLVSLAGGTSRRGSRLRPAPGYCSLRRAAPASTPFPHQPVEAVPISHGGTRPRREGVQLQRGGGQYHAWRSMPHDGNRPGEKIRNLISLPTLH
jgi:hypothetical protein